MKRDSINYLAVGSFVLVFSRVTKRAREYGMSARDSVSIGFGRL